MLKIMDLLVEPPLHPTAQKLVNTVIEMLKTTSYNNIKSESVLLKSGISRGPMYHHFANFEDLIETAQIQIYKEFASEAIQELVNAVNSIEDPFKAREQFGKVFVVKSNLKSENDLRLRVGIIHNAASIKSLREKLSRTQESMTLEWIKAYNLCVDKGWADPKMDARAVAILMQSTFIGRVIDNLSKEQMDPALWLQALLRLFDSFFFATALAHRTMS